MKNWCTCWPESIFGVYYGDCCEIHDTRYARGGLTNDRKDADRNLWNCVVSKFGGSLHGRAWAYLMYFGVRIGGSYVFCKYIYPRKWQRFNWR